MKKIKMFLYCSWGVILPRKSGVIWELQTGGVMCNHPTLEGVFIPLHKPIDTKFIEKTNTYKHRYLLELLKKANYEYKVREVKNIWKRIKADMHFNFVDVSEPKGYPITEEGLRWIKFTKFDSGWGHGDDIKQLIGKRVALIYPNCD